MLIFNRVIKLFGLICLFIISSQALAEELRAAQVDEIDSRDRTLIIGDIVYSYTPFIIIREYDAPESQRLPFSRLKVGDWVLLEVEYDEEERRALSLVLLDNERQAREFIEQEI